MQPYKWTVALLIVLAACTTPAFQPLQTLAPVPQADAYTRVVQKLYGMGYTVLSSDRDAGTIIAERDAGTSLTFSTNPEDIRKTDRLEIAVFQTPDHQTSLRVLPVSLRQVGRANATRDTRPSRKAVEDAETIVALFGTG